MAQEEYLFATGAIREAEKRLFSENDMERMIDASDAEQSFKIFNDLSYVDELLEIHQPDRFADVLNHDLGQVKDFISSMVKSEDLLKLLFAADDFHNLKLIFKSFLKSEDVRDSLSSLGYLSREKMAAYLLDGNKTVGLGGDYENIIGRAKEKLNEKSLPQEIDIYFEKEYFVFVLGLAKRVNSDLVSIIEKQIDSANIKIVFRAQLLGQTRQECLESLISGGSLDIGEMALMAEFDEADIIQRLEKKLTDTQLNAELAELGQKLELWRLEKILDNYLLRYIKKTKMRSADPVVVYAYYWGNKNAIKNISTIMTGKLNRISGQEIKERVRMIY